MGTQVSFSSIPASTVSNALLSAVAAAENGTVTVPVTAVTEEPGSDRSVIQDTPVLHLTATTSNVITGTEDLEHDDSIYMPEEFLDGIKGPRSTVHGQYISGYADNFEELVTVLDKHAHITGCKFHTDKLVSIKLTDQDRISFVNKFNTSSMRPRLFWMANKGEPNIPYDAVPFATANLIELRCSLGTTSKKKRMEDLSAYYCDAKIYIRGIWRFPLAVFRTAGGKISNIRKAKQVHMERLATEILAGVMVPVERYFFSLPTARAHTSHDVPEFAKPGKHFTPLHYTIVDELKRMISSGNTYIDEMTQKVTKFVQATMVTELALDPSNESLMVTREKINAYIYHLFKDKQVSLPEAVTILTEEQIQTVQERIRESAGIILSPQILQPVFRVVQQQSLGGMGEGSGTEEEVTTEATNNVEIYTEEEVNTISPVKAFSGSPSFEKSMEDRLVQCGNEVRSMLRIIENQTYACRSIDALHDLRRMLTDLCSNFSNSLYNTPTLQSRKRSTSSKDTPTPKRN